MNKKVSFVGMLLLTGVALTVLSFFVVTNGKQSIDCFAAPANAGPLDELGHTVIYQPERGFPLAYYAENLSGLQEGCTGSSSENISSSWNVLALMGDVLIWSAVSAAGFFAYTRFRRNK